MRKWNQQPNGSYQLEVPRPNGVLPSAQSDVKPPTRSNFNFYDNGAATFVNEQGHQYRQNADGTQDITYTDSQGQSRYQRIDRFGQHTIRAGSDENNYYRYDLDANNQVVKAFKVTAGGEPVEVRIPSKK